MKRLLFSMLLLLAAQAVLAQDVLPPKPGAFNRIGRTAVGFHGAANMWMNNFDKREITGGADLFVRHHITRALSVGLMGEYTILQTKNGTIVPTNAALSHELAKAEGFSANIMGWLHFNPGQTFAPYVYAGVGQLWYERTAEGEAGLPSNETQHSMNIPVGVGAEYAFSRAGALSFELGARILDNKTDFITSGGKKSLFGTDWYPTVRVGVALYIGDSDDDDTDGDGLTNGYEKQIGTAVDKADTDADGLNDYEEIVKYKTNALMADTDGDGLKDGNEVVTYHTSPMEKDTDHDGLTDGEEVTQLRTDPLKTDTDGDGLSDAEEVRTTKTDPLKTDTDADGLNDAAEVRTHKTNPLKTDTDAGTVNDGSEVTRGSNPLDPADDVPKPTVQTVEVGKAIVLEGIVFQTSKAIIEPQSEETLNQALKVLTDNPEIVVEVRGYTDNVGKAAANVKLSQRRADAVKAWLVAKGVVGTRVGTKGMGAENPIAENTTPEGRAKNRRIEFFRLK
jgi:outer membrane protein OmpA-like peptidoglycan-associated protein/outer membrane protein W